MATGALILFAATPSFAEPPPRAAEEPQKPFSLGLKGEFRSLEIFSSDQTAEALVATEFLPNVSAMGGIDFSYNGWGAAATFKIPGTGKDTSKYGTSSAQDYISYYFSDRWGADVYYQRYSGYYAQYPNGKSDVTTSDVRSDLRASYAGGNFYISLSEKYNIRSGFHHDNLTQGFRFGFLLGASLNYYSITADRSLLLPGQEAKSPEYAGYRGGEYWNLSLMPGIGLMHSEGGRFYASFIIMVGAGGSQADIVVNSGRINRFTDNYKGHAKLAAGANIGNLQPGIAFTTDFTGAGAFSRNTYVIGSNLLALDLFINFRF